MTKIQVIVILQIHFLNKEKHLTDRNIVKQGDIAMAYWQIIIGLQKEWPICKQWQVQVSKDLLVVDVSKLGKCLVLD